MDGWIALKIARSVEPYRRVSRLYGVGSAIPIDVGYSDIHPLEPLEEIERKRKLGNFNKPNIFRFSRLATPSKEI